MSFPQYYKILGISETATPDQIRQAYKRESLKTHPDRLPKGHTPAEKKRATEKFQAVADANYVLSDPVRRRDYDNLARQRGGFGAGSSSSKAGGFGGGYQQQQQQSSSSQAPPGAFPEFNFAEFMNNMNNARKSRRAQQTAEEEEEEEDEEDEYEQDNADKASGNFFKTFAGMFGMGGGVAGEKDKTDGGRPDANKMFGDVFEDMLAPEVAHVRPFYSWVGGGAGAGLGFIIGNVPGAVAGAALGNRLGAIRDAKGKSVAQVFTTLDAGAKAEILKVLAMKVLGSLGS